MVELRKTLKELLGLGAIFFLVGLVVAPITGWSALLILGMIINAAIFISTALVLLVMERKPNA